MGGLEPCTTHIYASLTYEHIADYRIPPMLFKVKNILPARFTRFALILLLIDDVPDRAWRRTDRRTPNHPIAIQS